VYSSPALSVSSKTLNLHFTAKTAALHAFDAGPGQWFFLAPKTYKSHTLRNVFPGDAKETPCAQTKNMSGRIFPRYPSAFVAAVHDVAKAKFSMAF
jgi:hypothetical protein